MRRAATVRVSAGVMCVLLLFVMLFSVFFMAAEVEHDCSGEDCEICLCLHHCESLLSRLRTGAIHCLAFIAFALTIIGAAFCCVRFVISDSPVAKRVRLNN